MKVAYKLARYIQRDKLGVFTLRGRSSFAKEPIGICGLCAARTSCTRVGTAESPRTNCLTFVTPIAFISKAGTEDRFNTIRLGPNTSERLQPGDRVAFADIKGEVYGGGYVEKSYAVKKADMLSQHARFNHTMLDVEPEKAPELLWHTVSKIYHNFMKTDDPMFSVIYARRDDTALTEIGHRKAALLALQNARGAIAK